MKRLVGPRFGAEAAFILAVAAVAFLLELGRREIFAAMLGAWILVALAELGLSRRRPAPASEDVPAADAAQDAEPEVPAPPPPTLDNVSRPEPQAEAEPEADGETAPEADGETAPEADGEAAPEPEETLPPAPVEIAPPSPGGEPESEPDVEPEPELEPAAEAPRLEAMPELEPEPASEPEPEPVVVPLIPAGPREWNLWELERWARGHAPDDPARAEEWNFLLLHLREFATAEGTLPLEFDGLVRETFGEVLEPTA